MPMNETPAWPSGSGEMAQRIRTYDWAATPLGPTDRWPQSFRHAIELMLAHPLPMTVLWGPDLIKIYNDAYAVASSQKHPSSFGHPLYEYWPEVRDASQPNIDLVWAGESVLIQDLLFPNARSGQIEDNWFDVAHSPLRDENGNIFGMLITVLDKTSQVNAERARREREVQYRTLFHSIDEGVILIERAPPRADGLRDWRYVAMNHRAGAMFGTPDLTGQSVRDNFPDEDEGWFDIYDQVMETGEATRFERESVPQHMVIEMFVTRVEGPNAPCLMVVLQDVTQRRRATEALQRREERQAFLLKFNDTLRFSIDPVAIAEMACGLLVEHLDGSRAQFTRVEGEPGAEMGEVGGQYVRTGPLMEGRFPLSPYGEFILDILRTGETLVLTDTEQDPRFNEAQRHAFRIIESPATISVPLVKHGHLVAVLTLCNLTPRKWTVHDVELTEEVAERTWAAVERARAEAALRTSEERLRLIVENARDYAIFTTDLEGRVTDWREGAEAIFGYSGEEIVNRNADMLLTSADNAAGTPAKERACAARTGKAPNVRWHICKDGHPVFIEGVSTALHDADGQLTGFLKIGRDATARHAAEERQRLLLAELQHRVRNILAMIRSVVRRSAETAESVEDYQQHLEGRITALAHTQVLLTRSVGSGVDLQNLILDELDSQIAQPGQFTVSGPDVVLPPKPAEVLGLAIHELATNATKYGALADERGRLDIRWALLNGDGAHRLSLIWSESRVQMDGQPTREGFGTELLTRRVPYELHGVGTMEFRKDGIVATIEFPMIDAPSILQTDAVLPRRDQ